MNTTSLTLGLILVGSLLFGAIGMLLVGNLNYWLILILLAISIVVSLFLSKKIAPPSQDLPSITPGPLLKVLSSIFFFALALDIIMVNANGGRTLASVLLIGLLFSITFIEACLPGPKMEMLVIGQIVIAQLANVYALVLSDSLFFGGTDIFYHVEYTQYIVQSGHVISNSVDPSYSFFPLYHILASTVSSIGSIDVVSSIFFIFPFISAFSIVLIFMIAKQFAGKVSKLPIFTALTWSLGFEVMALISYPVPRMIAFILGLILVWVILRYRKRKVMSSVVIIMVVAPALILMHSVTAILFVLMIILVSWTYQLYFRCSLFSTTGQTLILVMLTGYWFFVSFTFTSGMIDHILNPVIIDSQVVGATKMADPLETLVRYSPYLLMVVFFFIGLFRLIEVKQFPTTIVVLGGLISLAIFLPNPFFANDYFDYNFNLYRLVIFSMLGVAFMAAYGMKHLHSILVRSIRHTRNKIASVAILSIIVFSIFTLNITISEYSSDFNYEISSKQFSIGEVSGATFSSFHINETMVSDYAMARHLMAMQIDSESIYGQNQKITVLRDSSSIEINVDQILVLRVEEVLKRHMLIIGSTSNVHTWYMSDDDISFLLVSSLKNGVLYSNGDIWIVMPTSV